jgi:serine phosphatase RsbU (regulator of sigma subunit)
MVVGVDRTQRYDKSIIDLLPGDTLLLYTDGLIDAFNFDQQKFGRRRAFDALLEAIRDKRDANGIVNHLLWCQRNFTGLNRAADDTSLVVVRVKG